MAQNVSVDTANAITAVPQKAKSEWRRSLRRMWRSASSVIGLVLVVGVILIAIFAPWIAPHPEDAGKIVHFNQMLEGPSSEHWFGTDETGRDIFSRVLYGARVSLTLAFSVLFLSLLIGVPLGLIAGFWGGRVGSIIMRLTDIFLSVPSLVLALAVASVMQPTLTNITIAIAFSWWPWYTRLVQGEVLVLKNELFVQSSLGLGASKWRIAFKEVLPNCTSPIIVKTSLDMGFVILMGASLGYLGLGVQPPTPEWGVMISEGRGYLPDSWWAATFPGLAIFITSLGFNLFGDGLRDVFDVQID